MNSSGLRARVEAAAMARGGKLQGHEIRFRCPVHNDEHPSADYNPGKGVWICRSCGESGNYWDLAELLGLVDGHRRDGWRETRRWGVGTAVHHRFDKAGGPKRVEWERDGKPGLGGLSTAALPLYGLEQLSQDAEAILLHEGEKCADTALALGFATVGTACGATVTPSEATLKPLAEHKGRIYLCQDNDNAGRQHMERIAARLKRMGKIAYMVAWPNVSEKGDLYDYVKLGHTARDVQRVLDGAHLYEGEAEQAPKEGAESYRPTDVANGKRLVAAHGVDLRYCKTFNVWLCWTGQRWAPDSTGEVERQAKEVVQSMFAEAATMVTTAASMKATGKGGEGDKLAGEAEVLWKHAMKSEQASRIQAMIDMARSERVVAIEPSQLDRDEFLLNCQNGTIDLKTGQLRPHRREDLLTKVTAASYDTEADMTLWSRFLSEAIPAPDTRAYVQRIAGATIVGRADNDLLPVCHGEAGTGKTTFLNSIRAALGDYAAVADLETFTTKRDPHAPQPDVAALRGARMVAISEVDTGGTVALLKRASGGDPIRTRSHHQESFEFIPRFTIWIIANERPRVPDDDSGMWRRLREIPFVTKFAKPDPSIRARLTNPAISGAAVLRWLVEGCLLFQEQGIGQLPRQVADATADYRLDMDPLAPFLADCCEGTSQPIETSGKALWQAYQSWTEDNCIKKPMGRKKFSQRLSKRYKDRHTEKGTYFTGVTLRSEPVMMLNPKQTDTSEVSAKADVPVNFQNEFSYEKNVEQSVSKCQSDDVGPSVCSVCGGGPLHVYTSVGAPLCESCFTKRGGKL